MKRGKIHWITQNIKVGIETRKLIRYPLFMLQLDALTVKWRRIFFFCAASLLHETFRETEVDGGINDFVVLIGSDPAVDLRILLCLLFPRHGYCHMSLPDGGNKEYNCGLLRHCIRLR